MFIYNFKVNGGIVLKIIIVLLSIFMLGIFLFSVHRIFFSGGKFRVDDKIYNNEVTEINANNYTNILQAVHDDLDSYTGIKIKFTGYLYRVIDFEKDEFVLARDMIIDEQQEQSVVVGFLCKYKGSEKFKDRTWVELEGIIEKGKYHNEELPIIKVTSLQQTSKPENPFVFPPTDTYIPTSGIL